MADITTFPIETVPLESPGADAAALQAALAAASLLTRVTNVAASDFYSIGDTPVVIVPAAGSGKANLLVSALFEFTAGSHVYDSSSGGQMQIGHVGTTSFDVQNFNIGAASFTKFWHAYFSTHSSGANATDFAVIDNVDIILKGLNQIAGPIVSSVLGDGGSGYAPGDTGILPNDSGDAAYVVDTISGGLAVGPVATYHLSDVGTGYFVSNGNATEVSTGTGDGNFTVDVTAVTKGNGTATITVTYVPITKG